MFYHPGARDHGLPFDPFKSCIVPRPIGWISTVSRAGIRNLAPFSFFNAVSWAPPLVVFGTPGRDSEGAAKDTLINVEETGEFVVNVATQDLAEVVNRTSVEVGADVDEFDLVGLEAVPSVLVKPPRVLASPINLECKLQQIVALPSRSSRRSNALVVGEVIGVHISEDVLQNGRINIGRLRPIARLGYRDWAVISETFSLSPPELPQ